MTFAPLTVTLREPAHVPVDLASGLAYLVCAIVVGLLTRRRPAYGVAALLVLAPFDLARYVGPTTMTLLKAGLVGLLAALVLRGPDIAALRTAPVRAMLAAFALLLAAIALSLLHAGDRGAVLREGLKWVEYAVLFVGAAVAYATDPDERPFWRALELVVTLVALSALAEYALGAHSGMYIGGRLGGAYVPRIAGFLEGPNQLAGFFDVTIPVLVARALVHRDRTLVAVIALAAITDLGTLSRAGFCGAVIGVIVTVVMLRPGRAVALVGAGAAVIALAGVALALRAGVPAGYFSLATQTQSSDHLGNRAELWQAAIALWRASPIVGVGAGNYELDLAQAGLVGVRTHANSLYLQSLAEGGIVGLAATLATLAITVLTLLRSAVRRPLVVGALGATSALAVHQIADYLVFFPKVGSVYWLVLGVAIAELAARRLLEDRRAAAFAGAAYAGVAAR